MFVINLQFVIYWFNFNYLASISVDKIVEFVVWGCWPLNFFILKIYWQYSDYDKCFKLSETYYQIFTFLSVFTHYQLWILIRQFITKISTNLSCHVKCIGNKYLVDFINQIYNFFEWYMLMTIIGLYPSYLLYSYVCMSDFITSKWCWI